MKVSHVDWMLTLGTLNYQNPEHIDFYDILNIPYKYGIF